MLNIVVPMAGAGSRFASAGYMDPKPLIPLHGIPMIKVIIDNLRPTTSHRFIFICQRTHSETYDLESRLQSWAPGCIVFLIDGVTQGAACTVLTVKHLIDHEHPLMIANSDQFVDIFIDDYLKSMENPRLDGLIMTMKALDPKWSFVDLDQEGYVNRVVEKEVISEEATVGIYNFRHGKDFVTGAQKMIEKDLRVNGEFYVAPVYNLLIQDHCKFATYNIGSVDHGMYGLGTPQDLERFLGMAISKRAIGAPQ